MPPKVDGKKSNQKGGFTQVSIYKWLETIFEANELLIPRKKLTDPAIFNLLKKDFPTHYITKRLESGKESVNTFRNHFNRGGLTSGIPKLFSFRYNEKGIPIKGRNGTHVLLPEEVARLRKEHEERYGRQDLESPRAKRGKRTWF